MAQSERERETEFGVLKDSIQKVARALYDTYNDDNSAGNKQNLENLLQNANISTHAELKQTFDSYS
jgi:hypothetical protein